MAHTMLSPSNAHRWLHCTPSAVAESKFPNTSSTYADEGSLAHEVAAAYLRHKLGLGTAKELQSIIQECQRSDLWDDEMIVHAKSYADYCNSLATEDCKYIGVEVSDLSLEPYVPGGKGTADCLIDNGSELIVVDYKYGKGVKVSAVANPQLLLYAVGCCNLDSSYRERVRTVKVAVVQPRISRTPDESSMPFDELMHWAEETVQPKAIQAIHGEGDYCPSAEVCRFCRAKSTCGGLAKEMFDAMESYIGQRVEDLTVEAAASTLAQAQLFRSWLEAIENRLKGELMSNRAVPGWKLVEGKSIRKITDTKAAVERLQLAGFEKEMIYKQQLLGITDLERLVGKKKLPEVLGDAIHKPAGAPTMVQEDDPRPAMENVMQMFDEPNGKAVF